MEKKKKNQIHSMQWLVEYKVEYDLFSLKSLYDEILGGQSKF